MTPELDTLTAAPVVGRLYWVNCVYFGPGIWPPVFGPMHRDAADTGVSKELIGVHHIHLDARFLSQKEMSILGVRPKQLGAITFAEAKDVFTRKFRRRCQRRIPFAELIAGDRRDFRLLEERLEHVKIDVKRPRCPHQGADLQGIEPIECNGRSAIVCPLHLLHWDAADGRLIPACGDKLRRG